MTPTARRVGAALALVLVLATAAVPAGSAAPHSPPPHPRAQGQAADELPEVRNLSDLDDERARALVAEALAGLGFAPGAPEGPRPEDLVFVGNAYLAWIDQTGYYGELNGLWWLSPTSSGDRSFSTRAADGRPVNQLIVGEDGDGAFPGGYHGAEHIEMPNDVPEPHQHPACGLAGNWCAQYALGEAGEITRPVIPWWQVCNPGPMGHDDVVAPIEVTATADSLRLVYEGRLVKMADAQFPWDDRSGCHRDWLFDDGVRRPVHLRVGLELSADDPWVDRVLQVRNPPGNPPFSGPFSFIGGFAITRFPDPRPEKAVNLYVRPELTDRWDEQSARTLEAGTWNPGYPDPVGRDIVHGWMGQPYWLSAVPDFVNGRSLRLSHIGPSDNLDTGFCVCQVHGAVEMGGGLLHSAPAPDAALPVDGGQLSIEARRRLETAPATVIADVAPWTPPAAPPTTSGTGPPPSTSSRSDGGATGAVDAATASPAAVAPTFTG